MPSHALRAIPHPRRPAPRAPRPRVLPIGLAGDGGRRERDRLVGGLRLVADQALLDGAPTGQLRVQCSGETFQQDTLTCSGPEPASLPAPPAPPAPPPPARDPLEGAAAWSCTSSAPTLFDPQVTMTVADAAIRVETAHFPLDGARARSASGSSLVYDVDSGEDCSLSFAVDRAVRDPATRAVVLEARCVAEDTIEDVYRCERR